MLCGFELFFELKVFVFEIIILGEELLKVVTESTLLSVQVDELVFKVVFRELG